MGGRQQHGLMAKLSAFQSVHLLEPRSGEEKGQLV